MFCNLYELMTSLLCFLHYIIDQFRNTCDKKCTWFRTTIFIPCDKIPGKGDVSSASSVDLSRGIFELWCIMTTARDFFSRVLSKFKTLFWRLISVQSHCSQAVQTVHVWSVNVGRPWLVLEWLRPLPQKTFLGYSPWLRRAQKWHTLKHRVSWRFHREVSLAFFATALA